MEQEVNVLRQRISNMKMKKQQEEKRLRDTIKQLKAELYDLGVPKHANMTLSSLKENARRNVVRKSRFDESKHVLDDSISVGGIPISDGRIRHRYTVATDTPTQQMDVKRRTKRGDRRETRPRRNSTPLPSISQEQEYPFYEDWGGQPKTSKHTYDEVEAAARAFLCIFSEFTPKILKTFWRNAEEVELKNDQFVLDKRHLPSFLHRLVVFAYLKDNPNHTTPSARRTKPLVSLLKLRLAPYRRNRKYFTHEHFQNFSYWLQQRKEVKRLKPPSTLSNQNTMGPSSGDLRRHLGIGSSCLIWSSTGERWCEGEVTSTKYDVEGEWLVVRYFCKSKCIEKEVQRFSDLIGMFPQG